MQKMRYFMLQQYDPNDLANTSSKNIKTGIK